MQRVERALPLYDVMTLQQFAGDKDRVQPHIQKCGFTPLIAALQLIGGRVRITQMKAR